MNDLQIRDAIAGHLKSLITQRDDWQFAHVSDCYGCDYATFMRRNGEATQAERSPESCLKMALGVDVERYVCDGLQARYEADDYEVYRDFGMVWSPERRSYRQLGELPHFVESGEDGGPGITVKRPCTGCSLCQPGHDEIAGHLDFLAVDGEDKVCLEIKSTSFLKGRMPTEPSMHYVEQAATYGVAVGATQCGIIIACRESGRIAGPFWLDLKALEYVTIERAKAVLANTGGMIPPQAIPRYSWQPKYCALGDKCACKENGKA